MKPRLGGYALDEIAAEARDLIEGGEAADRVRDDEAAFVEVAATLGIPEDVLRRAVRRLDARRRRRRTLGALAGATFVAVAAMAMISAQRAPLATAPAKPTTAPPSNEVSAPPLAPPSPKVALQLCRAELDHIDGFKTRIERVLETRVKCELEGEPYLVRHESYGYWIGKVACTPVGEPAAGSSAWVHDALAADGYAGVQAGLRDGVLVVTFTNTTQPCRGD